MKKILLVVILFTITSCHKDTAPVNLTLDSTTIKINKGEIEKITVKTGNGEYKAESSNKMVAKVAVSGTTIAILGVEGGSAIITLTDGKGKTQTINVTVSYSIPQKATFIWNKNPIEFDNAGGYGISILKSGVAITNITEAKQYALSWKGGMTEGEKTDGKLIIATPEKQNVEDGTDSTQFIDLVSVTVVLSGETGNYIVFNDSTRSGEIFFSK